MDVSRFPRSLPRRVPLLLRAVGLALGIMVASGSGAAAAGPSTCSGTFVSPGVLAGTYASSVAIDGACVVNAGPAIVEGNLTLHPGAVLLAAFANNGSGLTVHGNLLVQSGATLILGCEPGGAYPCLDSPGSTSGGSVWGNLIAQQPLGVVVHSSTIDGSVLETGGGGGFTCANKGPTVGGFPVFGAAFGGLPVFSGFEDSTVHGNLSVIGLTSCWLGVARTSVGGNVSLINNQLADDDAIEILTNQISGNLICLQNSQVWDNPESVPGGALFPRDTPVPNAVSGNRVGQCVLSSPTTQGGSSGPGPF